MDGAFVKTVCDDYDEYLRDESRKVGKADTIYFPRGEEEIVKIVSYCSKQHIKVTVQGARTGITAGAVPDGGQIINLEKMNRIAGLRYDEINDSFIMSVQPGVRLSDLRKATAKKAFDTEGWSRQSIDALDKMRTMGDYFFPPDPTESTASIGGMVACNASGARSYLYGPTRCHIEGLRIVLPDGSRLYIKRGSFNTEGRKFGIVTEDGGIVEGMVPEYKMPDVKNASGYYAAEDMDLIDLFIGSEGTLGIITEIEIKLIRKPKFTWGAIFFFKNEKSAVKFVKLMQAGVLSASANTGVIKPSAIEYFNSSALELIMGRKYNSVALADIPPIKKDYNTAIYIEFDSQSENDIMDLLFGAAAKAADCGAEEADTWVASTPQLMDYMKLFRHAVPEAVNSLIDQRRKQAPGLTKLGTDMAVPDDGLEEAIEMYNADLAELNIDSVMFGHIGDNHIHVNIIPKSMEEYHKGKKLYLEWAKRILKASGTVSAEHGIGKLKVSFLEEMYGKEGMAQMRALKKVFDPANILNIGNLFNEAL